MLEKWISKPITEAEEFATLQYARVKIKPKEWVLQRLLRRPIYLTNLVSAARHRGLSREDVINILKELFEEGYRFCMVANPKGKRYVTTSMLVIRGNKENPFFNCGNCPVPKKTCEVWKERRR
ncbi:hypothetical protein KAU30_00140 [Candidatus Bathyarchaeota archaeon]|nr:hypothetical protein [Candidatus Bathyarchaeota archaeon]